MIKLENLTDKNVGREVIYTSAKGKEEHGKITSWNSKFIFVDYGNNCGRGTATSPEDLTFTYEVKR
jgi:hypothetical protein